MYKVLFTDWVVAGLTRDISQAAIWESCRRVLCRQSPEPSLRWLLSRRETPDQHKTLPYSHGIPTVTVISRVARIRLTQTDHLSPPPHR